MTHKRMALAKEIWPLGKWRFFVRGFKASNFRSTMRLNAIAHVRAQTIAARINPNTRQPGQPRLPRAATNIAASANGSAKTVCENRTKEPHFCIVENMGTAGDDVIPFPPPSAAPVGWIFPCDPARARPPYPRSSPPSRPRCRNWDSPAEWLRPPAGVIPCF